MLLLIDNYDSFTFNLAQYLGELGQDVKVLRNDAVDVAGVRALAPECIVISPGPGTPDHAGITLALIRELAGIIPVLGVCLGHQAIGQAFGGKVVPAREIMHGKTSPILHKNLGVF
ncbi:MAG: anthranilate synthase component II, partial [Rhodanobacteraceae bacterium]